MRIKNVSNSIIIFSDLKIPTAGFSQSKLNPGQEAVVFDEDAEKSAQLGSLFSDGSIVVVDYDEEPGDVLGSPSTGGVRVIYVDGVPVEHASPDFVAGPNIILTQSGQQITIAATATLTATFVDREIPTGLVDGVNRIFVLAFAPVVGTEHVFVNGLEQEAGSGNDYTILGKTITFEIGNAPIGKTQVSYRR